MDSTCRQLLLPASAIFLGRDRHTDAWIAVPAKDGPESTLTEVANDWRLFLSYCEELLNAGGIEASYRSVCRIAILIAGISNNSYRGGFDEGLRQSATLQAQKARTARRDRADERGRIVREAIKAVCAQQKVAPMASVKFAASIQAEVIQAARQFGLVDVESGMSSRSLQRHIAALLKDGQTP